MISPRPSGRPASRSRLEAIEASCRDQGLAITPLRRLVIALLLKYPEGAKAYDLLAQVRRKKPNAEPPTIYRTLTFLVDHGLAYKIGRASLFVLCTEPTPVPPGLVLVCPQCKSLTALRDPETIQPIVNTLKLLGHQLDSHDIEVDALCPACVCKNNDSCRRKQAC